MSSDFLAKCDFDTILTNCYLTGMDIYKVLANNIVYYRKKANMDQLALGLALGFDPDTAQSRISQWETGKRSPTKKNVERIAAILNVTSADLYSTASISGNESICQKIYEVCNDLPEQWQKEILEYAEYIHDTKYNRSGGATNAVEGHEAGRQQQGYPAHKKSNTSYTD